MVAHGLCSSGLFCFSNISYEWFGRRSLLVNKGLFNLMPRMDFKYLGLEAMGHLGKLHSFLTPH
jgi:NADH:ubiquinone oxidoreductase subunit 4 (subunit M)